MSKRDETQSLQLAFSLHRSGKFAEAAKLYRKIIKWNPREPDALHSLGLIEAANGNRAEAARLMARSLSVQATNIQFMQNYATVLCQLGEYETAGAVCLKGLELDGSNIYLQYLAAAALLKQGRLQDSLLTFDKLLLREPNHVAAITERSSVLLALKQYDAALAGIEKALALNPQYAEAHLNRGVLYAQLKRYEEAAVSFERALRLNPNLESAWLGAGNVLLELKRYDEALVAYEKLLSRQPDFVEGLLGRGYALIRLKRYDEATAVHDRVLSLKPDSAAAWLGRGNTFFDLRRYNEAIAAYEKALALESGLAAAWLGRGNVLLEFRRYDDAFAAYDNALAIEPDLARAWVGRGNIFSHLRRYDDAFAAYDKALSLDASLATVEGARIQSRMHLCDWRNFETECDHLVQSVRNGKENSPFVFSGIVSSLEDQLNCAKLWTRKRYPPADQPSWRGERYKHGKIRIGYVSADFRDHPVARLVAGVVECHDRSQFEVSGISIGPEDNSGIRRRLEGLFDKFIEATALGADQVAERIREEEIDILVDLGGFTELGRTEIFARRPAPVQVNYLGFPGTMGASYIDYIIGDPVLIPASHRSGYLEKVVYLPHSYMPHDGASRPISDRSFQRAEFALPETGFVFCCFNNAYKLNPHRFRSWMKLLKAAEGSVLWLSASNATTVNNLRREAIGAGVDPDRLVFAGRLPSAADHLARHRLADLFLDTLPYNAHATASDALWAGLPVLTQIGETFAGRVAASLLTTIGLPELIAQTHEQFETMAVELATRPETLATIKHRLAQNRLTTPLFNTRLYTRHIESAYATMHQRAQNGLLPDQIDVSE